MCGCPICQGDYFSVDKDVCDKHADTWIVTVCAYCNRPVFSTESGICTYHARMGQSNHGSNKDKRAPLRRYGLEN